MGNLCNYKLFLVFLLSNYCIAQNESNAEISAAIDSNTRAIEASSVNIIAKVNAVDTKPTAYRMSYYPRNHPAEP